jgi:hypothetical protein
MRQLSRIVLEGHGSSPDEQVAAAQDDGGYGELIDEIDRLVERARDAEERRTDSSPSPSSPRPR